MVYNKTLGEKIFDVINYILLAFLLVITLYPCWYVLVSSVSDPVKMASKGLVFIPEGFSLSSYLEVINYKLLWVGYKNTLFYVVVGTASSVFFTVMTAFCLTRKGLPGKNLIMMMILFTMYFGGGMIPLYLTIKGLGLLDNPLVMIIPSLISTYNMIITMSYIRGIPDSLEEAAKIDGASDMHILFKIIVPLAKPVIAVIALYYMVGKWNDYFTGLLYLSDKKLWPLQMVLRQILVQQDTSMSVMSQTNAAEAYAENMRYATIVVSTVPILCVYPFIQKYFVKGVMIGAVKG